jgi:hypothetical protein
LVRREEKLRLGARQYLRPFIGRRFSMRESDDSCALPAAIFAPTDDRFATAMTFKTPFGFLPVIACDKREAFAQGSEATKQSIYPRAERWIASLRSQ